MFSNKSDKKMIQQIDSIVISELKNIRPKIKSYIESALLSIIGLEKRYSNEYTIDHCNGRNSVLIDAFRRVAEEEVNKIAKNYKPSKEEIVGFEKLFREEIVRQIKYKLSGFANEKAQEILKEKFKDIKVEVDKILCAEFRTEKIDNIPF